MTLATVLGRLALLGSLPITAAAAQEADAVQRLCLQEKPATQCACATDRLAAELGPETYARYQDVLALYLAKTAEGAEMGAAWNGALEEAGADMDLATEWGSAHHLAIKACTP